MPVNRVVYDISSNPLRPLSGSESVGTFSYPIAVAPLTRDSFVEVEAVVDSGATYTWLKRSILEQAGVSPTMRREFVLADGRVIEREMAEVRIRLDGQVLHTLCIFGDEGTQPLLGAVTLEQFGLAVDPVNKRLVPVRGFLLGGRQSNKSSEDHLLVYDISGKPPSTIE